MTSKMILLVTLFIDFILFLLRTNLFFTVKWERSFSDNSVSQSPDLRSEGEEKGRMFLLPQEIWKKAY